MAKKVVLSEEQKRKNAEIFNRIKQEEKWLFQDTRIMQSAYNKKKRRGRPTRKEREGKVRNEQQ